jgi:Flp pilus assembly protein TadB
MVPPTRARLKPTTQMPHDQERAPSTSRLTGGSLFAIVFVFGFLTIVVFAILLGALTISIGVVLLVVPAAVIARLVRARRRQRQPRDRGGDGRI